MRAQYLLGSSQAVDIGAMAEAKMAAMRREKVGDGELTGVRRRPQYSAGESIALLWGAVTSAAATITWLGEWSAYLTMAR